MLLTTISARKLSQYQRKQLAKAETAKLGHYHDRITRTLDELRLSEKNYDRLRHDLLIILHSVINLEEALGVTPRDKARAKLGVY